MRKALTEKTVSALKAKPKRYEVRDFHLPGFGVRVSEGGRKTFFNCYRYGIEQRRDTLGVYPRVTLSKARAKALEALRLVDEGIDPAKTRRRSIMTVEQAVESFIRQYAKPRNKNWRETRNVLNREFVARYRHRDIKLIDRRDILEIIDAAIERGASYQANRIHSMIRKMFNRFVECGIVERSPIIVGMNAPAREKSHAVITIHNSLK